MKQDETTAGFMRLVCLCVPLSRLLVTLRTSCLHPQSGEEDSTKLCLTLKQGGFNVVHSSIRSILQVSMSCLL